MEHPSHGYWQHPQESFQTELQTLDPPAVSSGHHNHPPGAICLPPPFYDAWICKPETKRKANKPETKLKTNKPKTKLKAGHRNGSIPESWFTASECMLVCALTRYIRTEENPLHKPTADKTQDDKIEDDKIEDDKMKEDKIKGKKQPLINAIRIYDHTHMMHDEILQNQRNCFNVPWRTLPLFTEGLHTYIKKTSHANTRMLYTEPRDEGRFFWEDRAIAAFQVWISIGGPLCQKLIRDDTLKNYPAAHRILDHAAHTQLLNEYSLLKDETAQPDQAVEAEKTVESDETVKSDEDLDKTVKGEKHVESDKTIKSDETMKSDKIVELNKTVESDGILESEKTVTVHTTLWLIYKYMLWLEQCHGIGQKEMMYLSYMPRYAAYIPIPFKSLPGSVGILESCAHHNDVRARWRPQLVFPLAPVQEDRSNDKITAPSVDGLSEGLFSAWRRTHSLREIDEDFGASIPVIRHAAVPEIQLNGETIRVLANSESLPEAQYSLNNENSPASRKRDPPPKSVASKRQASNTRRASHKYSASCPSMVNC